MEYYNGIFCISHNELVNGGIISSSNYKQLVARGRMCVVRQGKGAGNYALIAVDSLPDRFKAKIKTLKPGYENEHLAAWIESNYEEDPGAVKYFHDSEMCGVELSVSKAGEYVTNASVLNTCIKLYVQAKTAHRLFGGEYDWGRMADTVSLLRSKYGHTLPASMLRFRRKVSDYQKGGYAVLISGKFDNQNARRMSDKEERICLSLACQPNKPWNKNVRDMYEMFVCGELDLYDVSTGELLDPDDVRMIDGEPRIPSEATITSYLNLPKNQILIKHKLESWDTFMHEDRPHVHRHDGQWSLSQITADDVDLTRKLKDTKKRVHAYYMYDDLSQCVIGASYGRCKDQSLVVACFRDMFRTLEKNGWGMPAGIEVENHLMSEYKDGFLQAGVAFSFVRFCAPLNSQEKRAESLNGAKKRSVIHKNHKGIGRFYGKGKWRVTGKKVSDADNDNWEDREYLSFEELVADDRADNAEWNNSLHPNQKKYKGMTRWDVLKANINPMLEQLDKLTLSRYIGESVNTSIRRNSTVRVDGRDWWLSGPEILEKLEPNNYKVTAYYLPDETGEASDVYLFQGDRYIDRVKPVETFCRVMAEQTDKDRAVFAAQQKRIKKYDSYLEAHSVRSIGIAPKNTASDSDIPEMDTDALRVENTGAYAPENVMLIENDWMRMAQDAV